MSVLFNNRLENAIYQLSIYHGEEIKAQEHPLHKAIVKLEAVCRMRPFNSGKQDKLFQPECNIWFACLWASRGWRNVPLTNYDSDREMLSPRISDAPWIKKGAEEPNPNLAMQWADLLRMRLHLYRNQQYISELRNKFRNGRPLSYAILREKNKCTIQ